MSISSLEIYQCAFSPVLLSFLMSRGGKMKRTLLACAVVLAVGHARQIIECGEIRSEEQRKRG
jgi:hypothetical protein